MDNLSSQRELEDEIRKLRIELKHHERRVKSVESKVNKDVERHATKRPRNEEAFSDANKRLRSAVSVVPKGDSENKTKGNENDDMIPTENIKAEIPEEVDNHKGVLKRTAGWSGKTEGEGESPAQKSRLLRRSTGDKQRDRRLFSSLLQGTLNSFKRSTNQENELKTIQKRKEVELKIEERVASEQQHLLELEKQKLEEERRQCQEKVSKVKEEIQIKEEQLLNLKFARHQQILSGFLKTKANPPVYFYPSKTDEFTERVLGTKKHIEPPKEVPEETPAGEVGTTAGVSTSVEGSGAGTEDVEVEEITRVKEEVGLPIMATEQDEDEMEEGHREVDGERQIRKN